jgi:hypothetical protein
MPFGIKGQDAVTPSTFTIDINGTSPENSQGKGPYMAALELWLDVADPAAGSWSLDVEYLDGTNSIDTLGSGTFPTAISLTALPAKRFVPLTPVSRFSDSSTFRISANLGGSAGTSKVSWRVWLVPYASTDMLAF